MSDQITIHTNGLEEAIRCAICENPIKSERGCDGSCQYDTELHAKIVEAIMGLAEQRPHGEWLNDRKKGELWIAECSACEQCRHVQFCEYHAAVVAAIESLNTHDELCENLAWYINERQRLLKVIEYSKPHEGLQRTIKKALERPHGEWKACEDTSYCKCSKCGEVVMLEETYIFRFCPHCGADMRPKEGDGE